MNGRPQPGEAAPHHFTYIDKAPGDDPLRLLEDQMNECLQLFAKISEEQSLDRYAPEKWSIRQLLNHTTDTERAFAYRALWFSRGFTSPLEGYDQVIAAAGAEADRASWAAHIEEFRNVRTATLSLFRNMPPEGWARSGTASGHRISVRALAFVAAGHVAHHLAILRERYLGK